MTGGGRIAVPHPMPRRDARHGAATDPDRVRRPGQRAYIGSETTGYVAPWCSTRITSVPPSSV